MPGKGQSKSPRRKRGKISLARSTYSLRAFAWGVAEWAKQFTTPDGTLAFPSPDKRRALEIRLTVLAVLASERHWTDLREVDRDAVDVLFALTLGPGMREAWQHQWKQIGSVGGAPVLLRCHNLQHYPKAAISLNTALTALSADGLGGQLARDPEGQSLVLGQLERVSTACDAIFRKHCPPEKDVTYRDRYFELLDQIDQAMRTVQTPQPPSQRPPIHPQSGGSDVAVPDVTERLKPRAKPGRKPDTDRKEDARVAVAWATGQHRRYADLERDLRLPPGAAKRALDRHRKRKKPSEK